MLVVSDNSPLNILIRIGQIDLLQSLFQSVLIPPQVADEMRHPAAPESVRQFIDNPPAWLKIQAPTKILDLPRLDLGERAAISLAIEIHADLLLVDESDGRRTASRHGLHVVGAIGILEQAANRGLIDDLKASHDSIRAMGFHVSEKLLDGSLRRHNQSKSRG